MSGLGLGQLAAHGFAKLTGAQRSAGATGVLGVLPNGTRVLPADQPTEIAGTIATVTLDPVLREQIKAASPHCKLIAQRMVEQIRAAYSIDDEMYFARIGVGAATGTYQPSSDELQAMTVFGEFVESVRQWGRQQRAELGL